MGESKRLAFLISNQSLMQNGGIGQFAKAFFLWASEQGFIADLIMDKPSGPTNKQFVDTFRHAIGDIITPLDVEPDPPHRLGKEDPNLPKERNFSAALDLALSKHQYNLIVCNVPESFPCILGTNVYVEVPTIFYTHNESMIGLGQDSVGPYSKTYIQHYAPCYKHAGIWLATQSQANKDRLIAKGLCRPEATVILPLFYTNDDLLVPFDGPKEGVLWIGRWDQRKDPRAYVQFVKDGNLIAKVITKAGTSERAWRKAFKEVGMAEGTDYFLYLSVDEDQKNQIIKGSKVFYNPSKKEALCITVLEALPHCHVVMRSRYDWSVAFKDNANAWRVSDAEIPATIKRLNEEEVDPRGMPEMVQYKFNAIKAWNRFVDNEASAETTMRAAPNRATFDAFFE